MHNNIYIYIYTYTYTYTYTYIYTYICIYIYIMPRAAAPAGPKKRPVHKKSWYTRSP